MLVPDLAAFTKLVPGQCRIRINGCRPSEVRSLVSVIIKVVFLMAWEG
jgi:hypothetical protein